MIKNQKNQRNSTSNSLAGFDVYQREGYLGESRDSKLNLEDFSFINLDKQVQQKLKHQRYVSCVPAKRKKSGDYSRKSQSSNNLGESVDESEKSEASPKLRLTKKQIRKKIAQLQKALQTIESERKKSKYGT